MDISKNSFELCGTDERGSQTLHKRLTAILFRAFSPTLPPAPWRWSLFRFTALGATA